MITTFIEYWQSNEIVNALKALLYAIFIFLNIPMDLVHILTILMLLDTFLGGIKALALTKDFSIKLMLWGIITKMSMLLIPMVVALVAKGLGYDFLWLVIAVMNILIVGEGLSNLTNILSLKSGKVVKNKDYITALLETLRKTFSRMFQRLLDSLGDSNNNK